MHKKRSYNRTPPFKNTAILYARFSPRPNAKECESCESQIADLRKYCREKGYTVAGVYMDKALSGGDRWDQRPGLLDAMKNARRGMVVMVRALDRLFRDTQKGLFFRAQLAAKGVKILSITEAAACEDTPESKFMATIFLAVAQYQREITRARTKAKMLIHQANGRRMSRFAPFGTLIDPTRRKRLIPCEREQAIISDIKELREAGLGIREIARAMEASGIEGREGRKEWDHKMVLRILRREARNDP